MTEEGFIVRNVFPEKMNCLHAKGAISFCFLEVSVYCMGVK